MKKQLKYKGLSKAEVEFLQRQNRKDLVEMIVGVLALAAIVVGAIAMLIGALK